MTRRPNCSDWVDAVDSFAACPRGAAFEKTGYLQLHECAFGERWPTPNTRAAWLSACETHARTLDAVADRLHIDLVDVPVDADDAAKWRALDRALGTAPNDTRRGPWPRVMTPSAKRGCARV